LIRAEVRPAHNWETLLDEIMGPRQGFPRGQASRRTAWPHQLYGDVWTTLRSRDSRDALVDR
jgi:hypothetical protein